MFIKAYGNLESGSGERRPRAGRRRCHRQLAGTVAVLALSVAVFGAGCGTAEHEAEPAAAAQPVAVTTATATTSSRGATFEAGGLVQAQTTAVLTSRIMAPVREVRVAPGDAVRAGQVLVVLDDRDLGAHARSARSSAAAAEQAVTAARADGSSARAALALARASHDRVAALHGRKSATAQELDQAVATLRAAEAQVAAVEARVEQAQASLTSARAGSDAAGVTAGFAHIAAPFAGVVTEKLVEPGNMAAPGTPLLRVEQRGGHRLDVKLDASRVSGLRPGTEVHVAIDRTPPLTLTGRVAEVARAMDADARAFLVKISLPPHEALRTGTFGRARIVGDAAPVLTVPAAAIVRHGQVTSVFVADRTTARLRMVVLGRHFDDDVEVVAGLTDGERVVVRPPVGVSDGTPLRLEAQ